MSTTSGFGKSSFTSAWGSNSFSTPKVTPFTPTKVSGPKHVGGAGGLFKNLLDDTVSMAKGIPEGVVQTVEHPLKTVQNIYHVEKAQWSPLVEGHFHTFFHNVYQHPLAPILDAATVLSLGAGGLGVAAKGAEAAGLARAGAADFARASTKELSASRTALRASGLKGEIPKGYVHYSGNVYRRALQKGTEGALTAAGKTPLSRKIFGAGGTYDYTEAGRQIRWGLKNQSQREAGARAFAGRQMMAYRKMMHDPAITAQDLQGHLGPRIEQAITDHSLPIKPGRNGAPPKLGEGWQYIKNSTAYTPHVLTDKTPEAVSQWLKTFGNRLTTATSRDPNKLLMDGKGNYMAVHKYVVHGAIKEADNTNRALHALTTTPLKVWKYLVLAAAPRYFVNNLVGNGLMLAFSHDPVSTLRGLHQAIADVHGTKVAQRAAGSTADEALTKLAGTWQHRWYLGAHTGLVQDLQRVGTRDAGDIAKHRISNGLYGATSKVAHTGPRMVALNRAMAEVPAFQKLYAELRTRPLDSHAFAQAADQVSRDPGIRDYVEHRASDVMGQYHHFNSLEGKIKAFVPFYSWDRHVMRFSKHMVTNRPATTATLAQIGQMGHDKTARDLGHIPDWMQGAIKVGHHGGILGKVLGGAHGNREKILLTGGLNPLSSAADVLKAGVALTAGSPNVGEDIGGQLNPIVTGAIQTLTGQSVLSGARLKRHGGVIPNALYQTATGNPVAQVINTVVNGQPHPKQRGKSTKPLLFRKDNRQEISSLLGLPVRDVSPTAAKAQYDQQNHILKGRSSGSHTFKGAPLKFKPTRKQRRIVTNSVRHVSLRHSGKPSFGRHPGNHLPKINF